MQKEKISEAEKEISKSYFSYKINKENDAIDKMKENKNTSLPMSKRNKMIQERLVRLQIKKVTL